ncbi:MAG: hypothetical protein KatS3mg009_1807 [Acidimicrobiia bacterium]|nr:MAG: hypothetical protein KatS3mg009_1807 [Acidimicrobiia bacterium]
MTHQDDDRVAASPGLSRRGLLRRAGTVGVVGAIAWSAPAIRTVRLDQAGAAGSPSPVTTAGSTTPGTGTVPAAGGVPTGPGGVPVGGGLGQLPVTGTEAAQLALLGGGSVVLGHMLTRAARPPDAPRDE